MAIARQDRQATMAKDNNVVNSEPLTGCHSLTSVDAIKSPETRSEHRRGGPLQHRTEAEVRDHECIIWLVVKVNKCASTKHLQKPV